MLSCRFCFRSGVLNTFKMAEQVAMTRIKRNAEVAKETIQSLKNEVSFYFALSY